jgi:hypothetical protein
VVPGTPQGLPAWLIQNKIAVDSKQAEKILLVTIVVSVAVGLVIYIQMSNSGPHFTSDQEYLITHIIK